MGVGFWAQMVGCCVLVAGAVWYLVARKKKAPPDSPGCNSGCGSCPMGGCGQRDQAFFQ